MSTELDVLASQSSRHRKGHQASDLPSSEKKRKRSSQGREVSPTKKRRYDVSKTTVQVPQILNPEQRGSDDSSVVQNPSKKSKKKRLPDASEPIGPSTSAAKTRSRSESTHSPFRLRKSSLYLPISPISTTYATQGLCADHISPLLLSYYPPLEGVLLSYSNVRLSHEEPSISANDTPSHDSDPNFEQAYANVIESYGPFYTYLTADFLLFAPKMGDVIEGHVILQNEGNVGLISYNFFNASIERKRLPKSWSWVGPKGGLQGKKSRRKGNHYNNDDDKDGDDDDASTGSKSDVEMLDTDIASPGKGHFLTSKHPPTVLSGTIQFRVVKVEKARNADREQGLLSIEGTLLTPEQEEKARKAERERDRKTNGGVDRGSRRERKRLMSGALEEQIETERSVLARR